MISLKQQQCEMKDTLWKLRQVVCLVIIRHVIFTSSPPVAGSCAWLIRAVHSQLAVLWCSSSPCEALYCISTSPHSPGTDCVCLLTNTHLSFHIYFTFFSLVVHFLLPTYLCSNVYFPVCIQMPLSLHICCTVCDSDVDNGCVITCRITVSVVTVLWYRCGRPRDPGA